MPAGDRVAARIYCLTAFASCAEPSVAAVRGRKGAAPRRTAARFLSNRKTPAKRDEDQGKIKAGYRDGEADRIHRRADLGGYLSSSTRGRQTAHPPAVHGPELYLDEFDRIWSAQAGQCPSMTDHARDRIHAAIFYHAP